MLIVRHDEQEVISWRPGNRTIRHASKALGSEHLTAGEQWFEPGTGAPLHHHPEGIEEVIVILKGSARFTVDGEQFVAGEGETVILPPLCRHGFVALEDFHIGGGGLSSAVQTTIFADEPGVIYDLGETEGIRLDGHRRIRVTGGEAPPTR